MSYTLHPIDEGLFSLKMSDDLKINGGQISTNKMENHILSILSFIRNVECMQIIYDSDDSEMCKLKDSVGPKIQKVLDTQFENKKSIQKIPPVFLILLDRKKDLITPILQNNSYSSMYYNLLDKRENVLDFEVKNVDHRKPSEPGRSILNENDSIWLEHKYNNCVDVIQKVQEAYSKFMEENSSSAGNEDVLEQIRKAPQLKEYIKDFKKHLDNLKLIFAKFNEARFNEVFFYEQSLATGVDKGGNQFNMNSINKSVVPKEFDKVRLAVLAKLLHGADDSAIQNVIFDKKDSKMLRKVLDICEVIERISTGPIEKIGTVPDLDSQDSMFYRSRAAHIFYEKITGNLDEVFDSFESQDLYPKGYSNKIFNNYIFKKNTMFSGSCPIVILFVKGGLSYNEVMEINNLKNVSHLGDFIPICGGTNVYSARSFIEQLSKNEEIVE